MISGLVIFKKTDDPDVGLKQPRSNILYGAGRGRY